MFRQLLPTSKHLVAASRLSGIGRVPLATSSSSGMPALSQCTHYSTDEQDARPLPVQAGKLTDFGTRSIFNEDHDMFREMCRRFVNEEVKPNHERWEEEGQISRECWLKAGQNGMLGITVPGSLMSDVRPCAGGLAARLGSARLVLSPAHAVAFLCVLFVCGSFCLFCLGCG
jgi:Acyl-CoA dehydrogenase, N-terminal domain